MLSYREVDQASLLVGWLKFDVIFQHKYGGNIRDEGKPVTTVGDALCCHSNATRASIPNPPNCAQLGGIPCHSDSVNLHPRVRAIVWACGRGQTDRQTHRQTHIQTRMTTMHSALSTTHAKCNYKHCDSAHLRQAPS